MQVLTDRLADGRQAPDSLRGAAVAIGNFDGVHRGHQAVLGAAVARARATGRPAGALLFDPHPRQFFQPDRPFFTLTPLALRLRLLAATGLDFCIVQPFDAATAALSAPAFVTDVLVAGLGVSEVMIGYDFHYGRERTGTPATLLQAGRDAGFTVAVTAPVTAGPGAVAYSSSGIRTLLAAGDMGSAAASLGHWWRVLGTVTGGAKRGTGLGFPTANLGLTPGQSFRHGIYAARVTLPDDPRSERFAAAAYLGTRPTFDNGAPVIEVFLLDFEGDLYGRTIEVEFIQHLRDDAAFAGLEALKVQMAQDCRQAAAVLAACRDPAGGIAPVPPARLQSVTSILGPKR